MKKHEEENQSRVDVPTHEATAGSTASENKPRSDDGEDYNDGESCWYCLGDGGFHDCGEDCCCCLDPDEITEDCPECDGKGWL